MTSLKNHLLVLTLLAMTLAAHGCSAVGAEGEGEGSGIDGGSLDGSASDGATPDAIILDGGCTPGTPISHEDPCLICSCGDDGVATCEPATAGSVCSVDDCCLQATTCEICEGDDCPVSGMACTGAALFSCEDGNSCTEDRASCTDGVCACENAPTENGAQCVFDANACTGGDSCQEGACVQGEEADMDDGNPCTTGVCVKGVIEQKGLEGPCSDGDPCTVGDTCLLAQCVPDSLKECPELDCAESGWCDSDVGDCVYDFKADGSSCEIDSACGGEGACVAGQCELEENPCDDLNPCTADICGANGDCQNLPLEDGSLCEDTGACTVSTCKAGLCQAVPGAGCDDSNPCTLDECDADGACSYTDLDDGASCGDDDVCNGEELCQAGACEISDAPDCISNSPCVDASCHPTLGCLSDPKSDGDPCGDDDLCNGEDLCQAGVCETSAPLSCGSDDECVNTSCAPTLGCLSEPIPGCGDDPSCGGYVGVLDGSTCIMVPDALSQMPSEFTIEFWIRPDSAPTAPTLFDKIIDGDWSNPGLRMQYNANGPSFAHSIHYQEINQTGGMNGQVTQKDTVPVGAWTHFAISRTADMKWKMFVNGESTGNGGGSNHFVNQSNDEPLWIGCTDFSAHFFPGAFDEIRISNVARYTGDFVPPTEPLKVDGDTVLLYHFDQTEGDVVLDSSGNGNHGNIMGAPHWEAGGPVAQDSCDDGDSCTADVCEMGACVHTLIEGCGEVPLCPSFAAVFDGASCIEVTDVLNPSPESYTVEMWFYASSDDEFQRILDKVVNQDINQPGFQVSYNDFGPFPANLHYQEVKSDGNFHGLMTGNQTVPSGSWFHYALVRTANGLARRFLNGESLGATQFNQDAFMVDQSNATPLWIGCEDFSAHFFQGRIDELRISAGERYSTSFDVKDVGFETDGDTIALYHFDEAQGDEIVDASGNGNHGTFHGAPSWIQESPVWTDVCEPIGENEGPFTLGKNVLDEPLENLTGAIPPGATSMTVSLWGAGGSGGYPGHGGGGAFIQADFTLEPGDQLSFTVAQGGQTTGGGGGASIATLNSAMILMAGGGGGAGQDGCSGCSADAPSGSGGGGGAHGSTAGPGLGVTYANITAEGAQGGGQTAGGAGGEVLDNSVFEQTNCVGGSGSLLTGGASTQSTNNNPCSGTSNAAITAGGSAYANGAGGGGGAGYYGGGAGGGKWTYLGGGGGGGSSWAGAQAFALTSEEGDVITAGGASDPDYTSPAGQGGSAGDNSGGPQDVIEPSLGSAGRIVVMFE